MSALKRPIFASVMRGLGPCSVVGFALAWGSPAHAGYSVFTNMASSTVTKDGDGCNLGEAIDSVNGQLRSDCVDNQDGSLDIVLFESSGMPFVSHPFQLSIGATISTTASPVFIFPASGTALIQGTGTSNGASVLIINAGATLGLSSISFSHTGSLPGRLITNHGTLSVGSSSFQGGNLSGLTGSASYGGAIYNDGSLDMSFCIVQNNNAVNGRGGGIFSNGPATGSLQTTISDSVIQNNVAAQGGGIYADSPPTQTGPRLVLTRVSVTGNKAVASEATIVPAPSGAISAPGTDPCDATREIPDKAFDDNLGTKWCGKGSAAPTPSVPAVLMYHFATSPIISAYSVTSANDAPERDPADWTLEASNNGLAPWTILDTVRGATFARPNSADPGTGRFLIQDHGYGNSQAAFSNPHAFNYYRLRITRNNGGNIRTQLSELALFISGRTGDGGGLYDLAHTDLDSVTFSQNIAGCTSSACACTDAWCASPISNTSAAYGKGGAVFGGTKPPPETHATWVTVAGNSAAQGGGVWGAPGQDWAWRFSIFGHNAARTSSPPEPDFHGDPHAIDAGTGGSLFGSSAGLKLISSDDGNETGLVLAGQILEGQVCTDAQLCDRLGDPKLLALQYNGGFFSSMKTLLPQSGSPALDLVPASSVATTDERGDGFLRGGAAGPEDWGAIEKQ